MKNIFTDAEKFNLKKSVKAINYGLLITFLISQILIPGSFFDLARSVFIAPFEAVNVSKLIMLSSILIIMSLGTAIAFQGKLFNIGISGQMLAGAMIPSMLASTIAENGWFPGAWIFMLIIGTILGSAVGGIAGYLKSKYNVHEIIGTIMISWIIYYIGISIFSTAPWKNSFGTLGSKIWNESLRVPIGLSGFIALTLVFYVRFLFKKTRLGFKIRMIGFQPSASDYAGFSRTKIQTITLAISGAFAGFAGVMYYGTYTGQYPVPYNDGFDPIAFNAIVVSLVAFKNPLLIVPVAFLFSALSLGGQIASIWIKWSSELMSLAFGLIMFFVAMSESDAYNTKKVKNKKKEG